MLYGTVAVRNYLARLDGRIYEAVTTSNRYVGERCGLRLEIESEKKAPIYLVFTRLCLRRRSVNLLTVIQRADASTCGVIERT